MHLEGFNSQAGKPAIHVSILVSNWMHLEVANSLMSCTERQVSILVSNWMHLEVLDRCLRLKVLWSFNPSF